MGSLEALNGSNGNLKKLREMSERLEIVEKERQEVLTELEYRKTWWKALVEHSPCAIGVVDKEGNILYESSTQFSVGWFPDEMIGRNAFEFIHPDDLELAKELFQELLLKPGKTVNAELRFLHKDGNYIRLTISGTNLLNDKTVKGIVTNYLRSCRGCD